MENELACDIGVLICDICRVDFKIIRQFGSRRKYANERALCIYEIKRNTKLKNRDIAKIFGCTSHCMVTWNILKYKDLKVMDADFKVKTLKVCEALMNMELVFEN